MIDASHIKVHQHGMGAPGGTEDAGRTKGGINTKIHVAADSHGMPIRFLITAGNQADCTQGIPLLEDLALQYVLADKGEDTDAIVEYVLSQNAIPVIPPRSNSKEQRDYDKYLYKYATWWKTIVNAEIEEACLPSMRQNLASIGSKLYAFLVCVSADIRHVTQRLIILSLAKLSILAYYCVHYIMLSRYDTMFNYYNR